MNLENIIRQMEEKSVSRKEKEKNVVEVTRGTINDSGTVTYMRLLYKGNIHGRYCLVWGLLILWGCVWMTAFIANFTFTQYRTIDDAALLHFYTLSNSLLHTL